MHEKMLWENPDIQYCFHNHIMEYDMKAASVSTCEYFKLLDTETIELLKLMPKQKRVVKMGLLQRDKDFSEKLLSGIREIRKKFLEINGLDESNVLSLHSDACIISSNKRIITNIDGVEFRRKGLWSSFIRYQNIEMLYHDGVITYKNIPEQLLNQHTLSINQYLCKIFEMIDNYDTDIFRYISKFQKDYLQDKFPEYYYIPFGKNGEYKMENLKLFSYIANIIIKETKGW
jgi:hypothetical protein